MGGQTPTFCVFLKMKTPPSRTPQAANGVVGDGQRKIEWEFRTVAQEIGWSRKVEDTRAEELDMVEFRHSVVGGRWGGGGCVGE